MMGEGRYGAITTWVMGEGRYGVSTTRVMGEGRYGVSSTWVMGEGQVWGQQYLTSLRCMELGRQPGRSMAVGGVAVASTRGGGSVVWPGLAWPPRCQNGSYLRSNHPPPPHPTHTHNTHTQHTHTLSTRGS